MQPVNKLNLTLIFIGAYIWAIFFAIQGQYLNNYLRNFSNFNPLLISFMISVIAILGSITSIFIGAISDNLKTNFGKRKIFILICGTLSATLLFLVPINQNIYFVISINVIISVLNIGAYICNNSLIPDIAHEKQYGLLNALAFLGTSLGMITGFSLMLMKSSNVFFITGAITSIGFILIGLLFKEPLFDKKVIKWKLNLMDTFQINFFRKEKSLFKFLISHLLLHLGINIYTPFLLIFLTQPNDSLNRNLVGLGLSIQKGEVLIIFAVMNLVGLLAITPIGYLIDRVNLLNSLIFVRFFFSFATILIGLSPIIHSIKPLFIGIIFIIPYSITNCADIIIRTVNIQKIIPKDKRGQLFGLFFFITTITQIPGVIIGGLLAYLFQRGYQFMFIIGAIFSFLSIIPLILDKYDHQIIQNKSEKRAIS